MAHRDSVNRVCLAYSGGLDTSVILRWLIEEYDCEVVAYCADVGQEEELSGLPEKAAATGAVDCVVKDLKEEFARDYVYPAIQGSAVYEGVYLLGTALARPLIAKHQVEVARATGCDAVAHGATGKGNDQVRFELAFRALAPRTRGHRSLAGMGPSLPDRLHQLRPEIRYSDYRIHRETLFHGSEPDACLLRGRNSRRSLDGARGGDVHHHGGPGTCS